MKENLDSVYYDKKKKLLVQIRDTIPGGYICGHHSKFYNDTKTTVVEIPLSDEYVEKNLTRVDFVDKFCEYSKYGVWIVSEKKIKEEIKDGGN